MSNGEVSAEPGPSWTKKYDPVTESELGVKFSEIQFYEERTGATFIALF